MQRCGPISRRPSSDFAASATCRSIARPHHARRDLADARDRLQAHAQELPALRQALLDSRETLLWAASYPERSEAFGFTAAAALGLREPIRRALGTDARIEFSGLVAALEEDATAIAETFGAEQKRQLGIEVPRSPATEALWESDPASVEWKKQEIERVQRQLGLRR